MDKIRRKCAFRRHYNKSVTRRLSNGKWSFSKKRALLSVRSANYAVRTRLQKNHHRPSEPFFKSSSLNNNAVTRESIRKMRSANFVSKFLQLRLSISFFAATIVCLSLDLCFCISRFFVGVDAASAFPFRLYSIVIIFYNILVG